MNVLRKEKRRTHHAEYYLTLTRHRLKEKRYKIS